MPEGNSFFKQLGEQARTFWAHLSFPQKASLVGVVLSAIFLFSFLVVFNTSGRYAPLFIGAQIDSADMSDVLGYLDNKGIPYVLKDKLIMVPYERANSLRMELAESGLPKPKHSQGFELFDSPTWIKGEKELQVMEMRALKGQLESDISSYNDILSANISLDISPPRPFGGSIYRTTASVILKLRPGTRISNSELRAITYHLSGAVRGLEPNMIAISDTTGHLYQAIDPDGGIDTLRSEEVALEDHIKAKIDGLLAMAFGINNFYTTVQVVMNREQRTEHKTTFKDQTLTNGNNKTTFSSIPTDSVDIKSSPGRIQSISASVAIDKTDFLNPSGISHENDSKANLDQIKKDIENQIMTIIKGYGVPVNVAVDFVNLNKGEPATVNEETVWSPETQALIKPTMTLIILFVFVVFLIGILVKVLMIKITPQKDTEEKNHPTQKNMLNEIHRKIQRDPQEASEKLKEWINR